MVYRNGNYAAFYVAEPFNASALGAHATKDFCYYNMLRSWKGKEASFPFNDSHDKTYWRAPRKTSTRPPLIKSHRSESAPSRLR